MSHAKAQSRKAQNVSGKLGVLAPWRESPPVCCAETCLVLMRRFVSQPRVSLISRSEMATLLRRIACQDLRPPLGEVSGLTRAQTVLECDADILVCTSVLGTISSPKADKNVCHTLLEPAPDLPFRLPEAAPSAAAPSGTPHRRFSFPVSGPDHPRERPVSRSPPLVLTLLSFSQ